MSMISCEMRSQQIYRSFYSYVSNYLFLFVFISNSFVCFSLYSEHIGFNPYILKYDKINYDTNYLDHRHNRVRRSIDPHLYINFNSHDRQFKLKLTPTSKHTYKNELVEIDSDTQVDVNNLVNFYEGVLTDEPDDSYVSGSVIDGVFYGTIYSKKDGKYYIESSRRYNHTLDSHSIIYNENHIDLNHTKVNMIKRSVKRESDEDTGCGSNRNPIKDWMKREQESLYKERVKSYGYDPFAETDDYKIYQDDYEKIHGKYKYSKEANENYKNKKKRDSGPDVLDTDETNTAERVYFPESRTICNLYLRVDPQLHTEIFNNEGNRDPDKTITFLLFYLNKHVEALNSIYNSLPFYNTAKDKYLIGLQFMIYRTKIITEEQCRNKTILSAEELKLCEPYLDVSTFLNYVSLDNFTDYCLSYTFTARDFTDGTLGLAWVAKLSGSVGGVCEKRQTLQGIAKSLNSGIVTVVNYQARVPEAVSQITFAHEVGHNFGSEHDPDDSVCSPGSSKGGNYIMYRRATTGNDKNNRNFSQCSRDQMGPIIHAIAFSSKFCFKQYSGSLCGNGIVEEGEECDCGYGTDCKESCCIDASQEVNKCKLKPGKECSPSQGPCCDNSCKFASSKTICQQSNECLNDVSCTGRNATCPRGEVKFFKPDKTECNSGTQVCRSGVCSGSICEKYEMRQCFLEGDLKDKKQDKAILCHLACTGEKTDHKCVDSFQIPEMINPISNTGLILKPGSPCIGTLGYCDIFSKCRAVDGEGPLARLKKLLLNPQTLSTIRDWITTYWWAAALIGMGLILFMAGFIKVCSVHTPSSNPRKPPALKITETLRRPMKRLPHLPHMPHLHHHQSASTGANPERSNKTRSTGQSSQMVNEKVQKQKYVKASSSNGGHKRTHQSHHSAPVQAKSSKQVQQSSRDRQSGEKDKKNGIFSKRHKSTDYHYYNNNHPLHPMPNHHKPHHQSNNQSHLTQQQIVSDKNRKKHDEIPASSRNRSKSVEQGSNQQHGHHRHRQDISQNKRQASHEIDKKSKSKTKSLSPSKHKSEFVQKFPSSNHAKSSNDKGKNRKRSSTESSSIDA